VRYKVFYALEESVEDAVAGEDAVEMDHADIYSELFGGLAKHGDFFGMVDANGTTLQVMYHAERDRYWFEIPVENEGGSYGRFLDFDQAANLIKSLQPTFDVASFPSFVFEPWNDDEIVDD
jgi:hypothetical protein